MNTPYQPAAGLNSFQNTPPTGGTNAPMLAGQGSPEGVMPGVPGQTYCDMDTQDLYTKISGVGTIGWQKTGKLIGYMQVVAAPA